jgi:hypothetical protein
MTRKIFLTCLILMMILVIGCPPRGEKPPDNPPPGNVEAVNLSGSWTVQIMPGDKKITASLWSDDSGDIPTEIQGYIGLEIEKCDLVRGCCSVGQNPPYKCIFTQLADGTPLQNEIVYYLKFKVKFENEKTGIIEPMSAIPFPEWQNNHDVILDSSNKVFATGSFMGKIQFTDTIRQALASDIYTYRYDEQVPANSKSQKQGGILYDGGKAITMDSAGDIFITGYVNDESKTLLNSKDIIVLKFSNDQVFQWSKTISGTGTSDEGRAIAVDDNYIYIAGAFDGTLHAEEDYTADAIDAFLMRIDKINYNNPVKTKILGSSNKSDKANDIMLIENAKGKFALITGMTVQPGAEIYTPYVKSYALPNLDFSGECIEFAGLNKTYNIGERLAEKVNSDNIYMVGYIPVDPGYDEFFRAEITSDMTLVNIYISTLGIWDEGEELSINTDGSVYMIGKTGTQQSFRSYQYSDGRWKESKSYNKPSVQQIWMKGEEIVFDYSENRFYIVGSYIGASPAPFPGLFLNRYNIANSDCEMHVEFPSVK